MNSKYKWWIIGGVSFLILATLTSVIIIRKRRKSSTKNISNESNANLTELKKSSSVDNNSQAVKITEKKLSQFNDTLSHYEYKNNSLYDKDTGGKISENAGWGVWGLLYRNYNNLLSGVNNDTSINKETKEYSLNVLNELKKSYNEKYKSYTFKLFGNIPNIGIFRTC
jgi:hypothetical protein